MFRTEIQITPSPVPISLRDTIITIGSCFSDAMGNQLTQNKFNTLINPFGVIYNPHSIFKVLRYAIHNHVAPEHTYTKNLDVFFNYDFHSKFSALTKHEIENTISDTIGVTHYVLKDANWLLITLGTAWVYERKDTGDIVANCHKVPATHFSKTLLSQKKILESFEEFYKELKKFNPTIRLLFTVSPVRHVKDTLTHNSVSKSVLRLACHTLTETYSDVFYFPAYEIMLDDLREYRFYKSDMLHPSEEAESYIWDKFSYTFFDEPTQEFLRRWQPIRSALKHKAFHPTSLAHQGFLKNTLKQLEALSTSVNLEHEIKSLKSKLI